MTPRGRPLLLHLANTAAGNLQSFPSCVRLWLGFFLFPPFPFSFLNIELMDFKESPRVPLLASGEWKENMSFAAGFKVPFGLPPSQAGSPFR